MHVAYAGRLLAHKAGWIFLGALIGLNIAAGVLLFLQSYSTSTYLVLSATPEQASLRAVSPERYFKTQSQRLLSDPVMNSAVSGLGAGITPDQLRRATQVENAANSDVLELKVDAPSSQESRARSTAIVQAIRATNLTEIELQLLWTAEPQPRFPPAQILAGGFVGGIFLAGVLVLFWGTGKRPILDPRFIQLSGVGVEAYPLVLGRGRRGSRSDDHDFIVWLAGRSQAGRVPLVVNGLESRMNVESLVDRWEIAADREADPGARRPVDFVETAPMSEGSLGNCLGRVVLLIGLAGRTTERAVEDRAQILAGSVEKTLLVLVSGRRARHSRRAN